MKKFLFKSRYNIFDLILIAVLTFVITKSFILWVMILIPACIVSVKVEKSLNKVDRR